MYTFTMSHVFENGKSWHDQAQARLSNEYKQAEAALRQYEADNNIQRTESWPDLNRSIETWTFPSEELAQQWKIQYQNLILDNFAEDAAVMGYVKTATNQLNLHLPS